MPAQSSLSKVVNKRPTESAAKPKRVSARKDLPNVVGAGAARADAEHEESSSGTADSDEETEWILKELRQKRKRDVANIKTADAKNTKTGDPDEDPATGETFSGTKKGGRPTTSYKLAKEHA